MDSCFGCISDSTLIGNEHYEYRLKELVTGEIAMKSDVSKVAEQKEFYTCELLGNDVLFSNKEQAKEEIIMFLRQLLSHEKLAVTVSVLMISWLNDAEKHRTAVDNIFYYINRIFDSPQNLSLRTISMNKNEKFKSIEAVIGGMEFLKAVGFVQTVSGSKGDERSNLVIGFDKIRSDLLASGLDMLKISQSGPLKSYINESIFVESSFDKSSVKKYFPSVKLVQELLKKLDEKDFHNRDEHLQTQRLLYTLVRISYPNDVIFQGVFFSRGKIAGVRAFVKSNMNDNTSFHLFNNETEEEITDDQVT